MDKRFTYSLFGIRKDGKYINLDSNLSFDRAVKVREALMALGDFLYILIYWHLSRGSSN